MARVGILGQAGLVSRNRQNFLGKLPAALNLYYAWDTDLDTTLNAELTGFCPIGGAGTVDTFNPYEYTSLKNQIYAYKIPIFSDNTLDIPAPEGIYSTSAGGPFAEWYYWDGYGWRDKGTCA